MRPVSRFNALAMASREAGLILGLGCALVLNTLVLATDAENSHRLPTSAPDKNSTESAKPAPRPVDQAHVMADVGYHFANLWFAVENRNWPLAQYYLGETRSHLAWAVSIHPMRKTSTGTEVDLKGIFDAVDNSLLSEAAKAIETKDTARFKTAYQQTLVGCYACHTACEKPFLRLQIPTAPAATIISFPPEAVITQGKAPDPKVQLSGALGTPTTLPCGASSGEQASASWLNQTTSPRRDTSALEAPSNFLTPRLNLNSDALVTLDNSRYFNTNSLQMEPFAVPDKDVDWFGNQGPKHSKRFQFLGGDNPVDDMGFSREVGRGPSRGWPLFSIHF